MNANEAADIIDVIADSLEASPNQFHFSINVSGMSVSSNVGAPGLIVSATGGGPNSNTTGMSVTLNASQIEIAHQNITGLMNDQMQRLIDSLRTISDELKSKERNKGKIRDIIESLKSTWVPQVVISVLSNIISKIISL